MKHSTFLPAIAIAASIVVVTTTTGRAQFVPTMPAECRPFTKTIPAGTEFEVKSWSAQSAGGELLTRIAFTDTIEIPGRKVEKPETANGEAGKIVLIDTRDGETMHQISLTEKGEIDKSVQPITLSERLFIDVSKWSLDAREAIFDDSGAAARMTAADSKNSGLFRFEPQRSERLRRRLFAGALNELVIPAGARITVKDFKLDDLTVTYVLKNLSTPNALKHLPVPNFADWFGLKFKMPHSSTLEMLPNPADDGSLRVLVANRVVEGTSVELGVVHRNIPFNQVAFRGCIGLKSIANRNIPWSRLKAEDLVWLEIDNATATSAKSGVAQVNVKIPALPETVESNAIGRRGKVAIYTPGFGDTVQNWLFGGEENARIAIWASDGNDIVYVGSTTHFVDDHIAALIASIAAFLIAYFIVAILWKNKTNNAAATLMQALYPLNVVRGHNGTASLANLQIYWWSLAVFGLMIFVWVATGGLATINETILWLLGVGGAGSLAAKAVAINTRRALPTQQEIEREELADKVPVNFWQLISDDGRLDLTRLQMLLFTVITGIFVVTTVWTQVTFPEIPNELLALMGISNGVYVLGKLAKTDPLANNPFAIVASLQYQLTLKSDFIASREEKNEKLKEEIEKLKKQIGILDTEMEEPKKEIAKLDEEIKGLESDKAASEEKEKKKKERDALKAEIKKPETEKTKLEDELKNQNAESKALGEQIEKLKTEKTELETKIEEAKKKIKDE